jgi:hypothetical protein
VDFVVDGCFDGGVDGGVVLQTLSGPTGVDVPDIT